MCVYLDDPSLSVWHGWSCNSLFLLRFCMLKTPTVPFSKLAWCPNVADKFCIDFVERNQALLDWFMQNDYDRSDSLKAYSKSAMGVKSMPQILLKANKHARYVTLAVELRYLTTRRLIRLKTVSRWQFECFVQLIV